MPFIEIKSLNFEKKQMIVQHVFETRMKGKEINFKFLENLQNKRWIDAKYLHDIVRCTNKDFKLFTCDRNTRLKFLRCKKAIEEVVRELGIIKVDEKGWDYFNRSCLIDYKTFCTKMAKRGVKGITTEEARGILGEYYMAALFPFCNYDYVVASGPLSDSFETALRGHFVDFVPQLLEVYKDNKGWPMNAANLSERFLKKYFIFMDTSDLESIIAEKGIINGRLEMCGVEHLTQDIGKDVSEEYSSQESLQTKSTAPTNNGTQMSAIFQNQRALQMKMIYRMVGDRPKTNISSGGNFQQSRNFETNVSDIRKALFSTFRTTNFFESQVPISSIVQASKLRNQADEYFEAMPKAEKEEMVEDLSLILEGTQGSFQKSHDSSKPNSDTNLKGGWGKQVKQNNYFDGRSGGYRQ